MTYVAAGETQPVQLTCTIHHGMLVGSKGKCPCTMSPPQVHPDGMYAKRMHSNDPLRQLLLNQLAHPANGSLRLVNGPASMQSNHG